MTHRWTDDALVLNAAPSGESMLRLDLLTESHGRHAGLLRGNRLKASGALEPGAAVQATWTARFEHQLGSVSIEPRHGVAARLFHKPAALLMLQSACALLVVCLPERLPAPGIYAATAALFEALTGPAPAAAYARWELGLCAALGVGFDLSSCAVTGQTGNLCYVSPKTLRAVSAEGAGEWADRLLRLPAHLIDLGLMPDDRAMLDGLRLTGYALAEKLLMPAGRALPPARQRLEDRFARMTEA